RLGPQGRRVRRALLFTPAAHARRSAQRHSLSLEEPPEAPPRPSLVRRSLLLGGGSGSLVRREYAHHRRTENLAGAGGFTPGSSTIPPVHGYVGSSFSIAIAVRPLS